MLPPTLHPDEIPVQPPRPEAQPEVILILIVEDETVLAETLAEWVSGLGYTAQLASNGREALHLARQRWPVLVLTDLMMPQMNGSELIAALHVEAAARQLALPRVVLLTAVDGPAARTAGADVVVRKPFNLDRLEQVVLHFLEQPPS